jgi:hypothetical protein
VNSFFAPVGIIQAIVFHPAKCLRFINVEFTVVLKLGIAAPQNGLFIVLGWLFCFFFSTKKEKKKSTIKSLPDFLLTLGI